MLTLVAPLAAGCGASVDGTPDGKPSLVDGGGLADGVIAVTPDAAADAPPVDAPGPGDGADAGPSEVVTPCPIARVGELDTLAGGAIGVGLETLLVATGEAEMGLQLVARQPSGLAVLASTRLPVFVTDVSGVVGQAVDGGLVAVGRRGERDLSLVSVTPATDSEPAALQARGSVTLDGQLVGLTGSGRRLWTCTSDFLAGAMVSLIDITDPDAPVVSGAIGIGAGCGSIAVNDDGTHIYVNTGDGVRFVDATPLATGGDPTLSDVFSPAAAVTTSSGHLILNDGTTVRVLEQGDLAEVASVPMSGALAATLANGRLLVEGFRTVGGGMEGYATLWDVLGAQPPAQLDEVILMTVSFIGDPPPSFRSAVTLDGSTLVTQIGSRLFDLSRGRLDELRVPALVALDQLSGSGAASAVRAFGLSASALIDVSDPTTPAFAGGGSFGVPETADVVLDETSAVPRLASGRRFDDPDQVSVGITGQPDPLPVDRVHLDGDGHPQITGSFALPNRGRALLLIAGGTLYRLVLPVTPSFDVRLQGFPLATLGSDGAPVEPGFDLGLSPSPPLVRDPKNGSGTFAAFDVDPQARLAVVTSGTPSIAGGISTALFWIDLSTVPPKVVEEVHLSELPRHLRVAGTRAVCLSGLDLLFFELGHGEVAHVPSGEAFFENLLSFDGRVVYYGQSLPFGLGLAGFGTSGPPPPALLLDEVPQSLVATDHGLVVGSPSELVTIAVTCDGP